MKNHRLSLEPLDKTEACWYSFLYIFYAVKNLDTKFQILIYLENVMKIQPDMFSVFQYEKGYEVKKWSSICALVQQNIFDCIFSTFVISLILFKAKN